MKKQDYKEQERHYYFFDYLFWLGEITWENYHKVNFKQPEEVTCCGPQITLFIFMPVLTIAGHFLDDLAFEVFWSRSSNRVPVSVFMTDRLFGKYTRLTGGKRSCSIMRDASSVPSGATVLFPSLFASYSRNGFIRNCTEMDN